MSESLRNDGRIWVPKKGRRRHARPRQIPEAERDYYLERKYPSSETSSPRDIASRAAKEVCDAGHGVGPLGLGVYLDFKPMRSSGSGAMSSVAERYGNLFEMYERITGDRSLSRRRCASTRPSTTRWAALWVDYNLQTTIPGLHAIGEANFSDHGANRLGASALMQGLADGYFVLPYTIGELPLQAHGLRGHRDPQLHEAPSTAAEAEVRGASIKLLAVIGGTSQPSTPSTVNSGTIIWDSLRDGRATPEGLERGADRRSPRCKEEFWKDVKRHRRRTRSSTSGAREGRPQWPTSSSSARS